MPKKARKSGTKKVQTKKAAVKAVAPVSTSSSGNEEGKKTRGRKPVHPWEKWFAKKSKTTLTKGKHYDCKTASMVAQLRQRAAKEGLSLRINQEEDQVSFKVAS